MGYGIGRDLLKKVPEYMDIIDTRQVGPVAKARKMFELMKDRPRKEVIETCVMFGLKRSTSSTQYQYWKHKQHP